MQDQNFGFLFLMDPYPTLNLETETSLLFMEELLSRQQKAYWIETADLFLSQATLCGEMQEVLSVHPFQLGEKEPLDFSQIHAFFNRVDPPFDQSYLHLTLILEHLPEGILQVNPPQALRNFNEKLFGLRWPELTPASITTKNPRHLIEFIRQHQEIIIKPLEECSGRGIEKLEANHPKLTVRLGEIFQQQKGDYITAQAFLKNVSKGDKRVFLVDGEVYGIVNRIPKAGSYLANIHQGAICEKTELTANEEAVIAQISPFFKEQQIFLVGLDLIDEKITEINLTSPSALRQINEVTGQRIEKKVIDQLLLKVAAILATKNT